MILGEKPRLMPPGISLRYGVGISLILTDSAFKYRYNKGYSAIPETAFLHDRKNSHYLSEKMNSACVDRCQLAQKPSIQKPKTSNRAQRQCQPMTQISLSSVALKHNSLNKNFELVICSYKAKTICCQCFSTIFFARD